MHIYIHAVLVVCVRSFAIQSQIATFVDAREDAAPTRHRVDSGTPAIIPKVGEPGNFRATVNYLIWIDLVGLLAAAAVASKQGAPRVVWRKPVACRRN